jgi:hypothetical protein
MLINGGGITLKTAMPLTVSPLTAILLEKANE